MAPQVSDEMRANVIIWHEEKSLSPHEITDLMRDKKTLRVTGTTEANTKFNDSRLQTAVKDTVVLLQCTFVKCGDDQAGR